MESGEIFLKIFGRWRGGMWVVWRRGYGKLDMVMESVGLKIGLCDFDFEIFYFREFFEFADHPF